jgi:L-asparaginase/Glu-tRNA(Gln) amidotransferase subunit D
VDIIYAYAGADAVFIDAAVAAGARGLVSTGFARGLVPPAAKIAFERLAAVGFPVVVGSRAGAGRIAPRRYIRDSGIIAVRHAWRVAKAKRRISSKPLLGLRNRDPIQMVMAVRLRPRMLS